MDEKLLFGTFESRQHLTCHTTDNAGAFFPGAQHLVVRGGSFNSNVHIHQAPLPASTFDMEGYTRIRRADINLIKDICIQDGGGVEVGRSHTSRRMYAARVRGMDSERAVIVYQGPNAEESWRGYVSRHSNVWHPNILQVFGLMCSNGMYAVITQDELLPHLEYLETNRPSPIMTVYSYACWGADIFSFVEYFMDTFPESPARISDQTFWIRRSTGRLCVELIKTDGVVGLYPAESGPSFPRAPPLSWNGVDFDVEAANMLSVEDYHRICCTDLSKRVFLGNFPGIEVTLGALIHCPRRMQLEDSVQVARTPTLEDLWFAPQWSCDATQRIRSDGWARFASSEIYQTTIFLDIYTYQFWFSQANHVFNLLNVTSAHNQYVFVANASFELQISAPSTENPVQGYLFLCPPESLRTGATSFCWPACPWFWSVDPAGIHPLSNDDALSMGFPAVELATTIWGRCWDTSVYDGLRQFHAAKGFDPESQELAQHMEFPLFEV